MLSKKCPKVGGDESSSLGVPSSSFSTSFCYSGGASIVLSVLANKYCIAWYNPSKLKPSAGGIDLIGGFVRFPYLWVLDPSYLKVVW